MEATPLTAADVGAVVDNKLGHGYGYGYGDGMGFGGSWIWVILLFAIFGNGGFGFGGGNNRGNCATTAELSAGFANSEIMSDLNDIILGQAQMQNFINQGFAGLNSTINTGFAGVNNAVCTLGYQNQAGFNSISREIADCCCKTQGLISELRYDNAKNTCDIIRASQDNTRAILDYLTTEKISGLQAENASLKSAINNEAQTATLLRAINKCPEPAYIVPNPYCCPTYSCGTSVL